MDGLRRACAALLIAACGASAAAAGETAPWLRTPHGWEADLAPPGEPGGRFVIEGRVLASGDSLPPDLPLRSWFVNLYIGPNEKSDRAWGRMASVRRLAMDPERPETYVTRDAHGVFHARWDLRLDRAVPMPAHVDSVRRGLLER